MNYVCGFMFYTPTDSVALVLKQKPEWQAGRLNGIGGKIEENETPRSAMVREFAEETGLTYEDWKLIRVEHFNNGAPDGDEQTEVFFFAGYATPDEWSKIHTAETEQIVKWTYRLTDPRLMYNLPYLLPMARILMGVSPKYFPVP